MTGAALLETMAQQAAEECGQTVSRARDEQDTILKEARAQSDARRETLLHTTAEEMDALDRQWLLKGEAGAAKAALVVQNDAVREVLEEVQAEIGRMAQGPEFRAVLEALLAEVMAVAPENVIVLAPGPHVGHVRQWLDKNGYSGIPVDGAPALLDGVAVQDRERSFRISNTLSGRFARVEQAARKLCMEALFEGNVPEPAAGGASQHG